MSTWRYCEDCNTPMDFPTDGEIIIGMEICKACGTYHTTMHTTEERIDKVNILIHRLAALENTQA